MPPVPRPIPRFIADSSQEGIPHGRWAERLATHFRESCSKIEDLPSDVGAPEVIVWFPERTWGGRTWVPATSLVETPDGAIEFFGHVSYVQEEGGEQHGFRAVTDFTDVLASENPDWKIDLNDNVVGRWHGESGMAGDVTLVWGRPMVRGPVAATAEIEGETADQEPLSDERFTLVALDAMSGYGDDVYMTVKLWNQRAQELASESLYAEEDEPNSGDQGPKLGDGPDSSAG